MLCPKCDSVESTVIDSRDRNYRSKIPYQQTRRRRKCLNCGFRFTTYEVLRKPEDITEKKSTTALRAIKKLVGEINLEV